MVCTVVTTTIATASISAIAVIGLIILLVARELADTSESPTLRLFNRHLIVAMIPLFLVFIFIVAVEVMQVIS